MKKLALTLAVSGAAALLSQGALADRVKGSARADFGSNELFVPCVMIEGVGGNAEGQYFDIVLKRRGKSFNYDLTYAEPEDSAVCDELADYAYFIDEDDDDDVADDSSDDSDSSDDDADDDSDDSSDDVADDDSSDDSDDDGDDSRDRVRDGSRDDVSLFASCTVREEGDVQTRSKIKVKARDLASGDYYAVITSGDNTLQSETRSISGDELELEFDSESDDVLEGAEAIEAGFIVDNSVLAELFDAATGTVVLSDDASCRVRSK